VKQLDRYVLHQMVGPFLFFVIIFGGVLWLNQALRIVDIVVSNGQSGLVFAELSLYLVPKVMETVIPVAGFSAALFLTNRMYSEAELVVFMGVGRGPANTTYPFFIFGVICFGFMTVVTHFLTPLSLAIFQDRQHEFSKEFLTQFVVAGEFATPAPGVTVFFGETSPDGNLGDVLINDRRQPDLIVTHSASKGKVISSENQPKLVLFDGAIQQFSPKTRNLNTIQFDTLSYDLSQFAKEIGERSIAEREKFSWDLPVSTSVDALFELNDRLVKSLLAVVVPMLGAIVLLSAGFSRNGFFLRIALGVVFMVAINSARGFVQGLAEIPSLGWPLLYAPVIAAYVAIYVMIRIGQASWKSGLLGLIKTGSATT
jgi:lipopolysaccharide export system permease protein